jgi:hypothetical protein
VAFRQKQSGSETRKRTSPIGFRATDAERAEIEKAAERAGLSVGSYVRSRALAKPTTRAQRRPPVETQQLAQLLGMIGALSGQVQALLRNHGGGDAIAPAVLQEAMAGFREAVGAILTTMGKHPTLSKVPHDH